MITINFQTRCRDAEHCPELEVIKEHLKNGNLTASEIKEMFKRELSGCCGSCEKNKDDEPLTKKLFKV